DDRRERLPFGARPGAQTWQGEDHGPPALPRHALAPPRCGGAEESRRVRCRLTHAALAIGAVALRQASRDRETDVAEGDAPEHIRGRAPGVPEEILAGETNQGP